MKIKKRLSSLLLCTVLLFTAIVVPIASYAAETEDLVVYDTNVDIKAQRETMAAPTKENYVFAGWYKEDAEAETGYTSLNKTEADAADSAVAKFVHKDVLGVRCQILADTDASSDSTALRMMTSVDSFKYSSVGFKIELQGKTAIVDSDTVYEIVKGYTKDGVTEYTAKEAFECEISQYFMSFKITEISSDLFEETFTITPFWITRDGTTVEGIEKKTFKISEYLEEPLFSIPKTADTKLGTPLTLAVESNVAIPESEVTWTSSDNNVATVANGVVTPVTKGEVTITAEYKDYIASCDVTVYTAYITTGTEWAIIYDDLSGYYKVVADLDTVTRGDGANHTSVFTGLIDLGGHTVKTPGGRLFNTLNGATIRNGHLVGTESYGAWGGIIADTALNVTIQNITADVSYFVTYCCNNNSQWYKRNPGGLFNFVTGTVTSCVVNVTLPSTLTVESGYPVAEMSAIGRKAEGGTVTMSDCSATLVNNYNDDSIHLLAGASNDVLVERISISLPKKADAELSAPITLTLDYITEIPASEVTWTSSDNDIATVANGVVTPVAKGTVTITAKYLNQTASCDVTVYTAFIETGEEWKTIYDDLSGHYKVVADLETVTRGNNALFGDIFTGLIDLGGHTVKTPGGRLFYVVKDATIRNGHFIGTETCGVWGGLIADTATNCVIENITADVTIGQTRTYLDKSTYTPRNAGGLFSYLNGGSVSFCVVNVTLPSNLVVTNGYAITDISAIGQKGAIGSVTMTACRATLTNNYNDDSIQLLRGHANNDTFTSASAIKLIEQGTSPFVVVIPDEAEEYTQFAAREFVKLFKEATGVTLDSMTESELDGRTEYIFSIGKTNLAMSEGVIGDTSNLNMSGSRLVTKDSNVYMFGNSMYGDANAVYDFMEKMFNYKLYAIDEYYIDQNTDVVLQMFDQTVIPDIDALCMMDGRLFDTANSYQYYRAVNYYEWWIGGLYAHTYYKILPPDTYQAKHPDWYTADREDGGLCLTNEEMKAEFVKRVCQILKDNPTRNLMMLGQEDGFGFCPCSNCQTRMNELGGFASGVMMEFTNDVVRQCNDWLAENQPGRDVTFVCFAYNGTKKPPVVYDSTEGVYKPVSDTVISEDNLSVMYVINLVNYFVPYANNSTQVANLEGWRAICDNMTIWSYYTNFSDYMQPFYNFETIAANYKWLHEHGITMMTEQGTHNTNSVNFFLEMKHYIMASLGRDVTLNTEDLIDEFMTAYYKDAAADMKELYQLVGDHYKTLQEEYGLWLRSNQTYVMTSTYWSYSDLSYMLFEVEDAIAALEPLKETDEELYNTLYRRVYKEGLWIRYYIYNLYYKEDPTFYEDMLGINVTEYESVLYSDLESYGVTQFSE